MALTIPGLDRITKETPKVGEALKKAQDYINANTTPAAGNRVPPPPVNSSNPQG